MSSRPQLASRRAGAAASLMSADYGLSGSFICPFINFEDTPAAVTCHVARFRDPTSTDNFRQAHGIARPTPREILRLVLFVTRAGVVLWRVATNSDSGGANDRVARRRHFRAWTESHTARASVTAMRLTRQGEAGVPCTVPA